MGHDPLLLKLVVVATRAHMLVSVYEIVGSEDSHPFMMIGVSLN